MTRRPTPPDAGPVVAVPDSGVDQVPAGPTADPEPRAGPLTNAAGIALGVGVAPLFGLASFVRRKRSVHPNGAAYEVVVTVEHPLPLLAGTALGRAGRLDGVVRMSHGLGLGPGGNDYRGFALRLLDGDRRQDLVLVSTWTDGVRQKLARRTSYTYRYCTVLPLTGPQGPVVFHVLPVEAGLSDPYFDGGGATGFRFQLFAGAPHAAWYPCADLVLGRPLSPDACEDLRFDPFNAELGLTPCDLLNVSRGVVYPASQAGRAFWERRRGAGSAAAVGAQDQASAVSADRPGSR